MIREKDGTITHNLRTAVIDPAGASFRSSTTTPGPRTNSSRGLKNAARRRALDSKRDRRRRALPFTTAERALIARLNTPAKVQRWLNALPYNTEKGGETLRSFRPVARLEDGALHARRRSSPPWCSSSTAIPRCVMSLESQDWLDHVIFIYRHDTGWGSVARSRDPGLHGRKPRFRSPRALARSYYDGYVDYTGRLKGFGVANLADALAGLRLAADDEECRGRSSRC